MIHFINLLEVVKGSSVLDIFMYILVLILSIRAGWLELKRIKPTISKKNLHHSNYISNVEKLVSERNEIEYRKIMKDQMRLVESTTDTLLREMRDFFFKQLENKGILSIDILASMDNRLYNANLEIVGERWRKDVQFMLRENGLYLKEENEIKYYIDDKFEILLETARKVFNTYYGGNLVINRAELHELHKVLYIPFKEKFGNTIRECRNISIKYHQKIKELDSQIEDLRLKPCYMI